MRWPIFLFKAKWNETGTQCLPSHFWFAMIKSLGSTQSFTFFFMFSSSLFFSPLGQFGAETLQELFFLVFYPFLGTILSSIFQPAEVKHCSNFSFSMLEHYFLLRNQYITCYWTFLILSLFFTLMIEFQFTLFFDCISWLSFFHFTSG